MQLTRADWIEAGIELIGWEGVGGVKITTLATRLGVTKGSFYWHFRDRDDYLEAIVAYWERDARDLMAEAGLETDPLRRIWRLVTLLEERVARRKGRYPDFAMFAWAHSDGAIARRVAAIERERMAFIVRALRGLGLPRSEAESRGLIFFLALNSWLEREFRCPETTPRLNVFAASLIETVLGHCASDAAPSDPQAEAAAGE